MMRPTGLGAALLLLALVPAPRATARPVFAAPFLAYPTGDAPTGVAVADFDLDGNRDVATCDFAANTITVRRGLGDGRLGPSTTYGTLPGPSSILAAYRGSNGYDLVVTNYVAGGVSVFRNDGFGRFETRYDWEGEPGAVQAAWGDVTQDGSPDMVVANYLRGTITVYNARSTNISAVNVAAGGYPLGVVIGDLNLDGLPDVVVTNYLAGSITILPGDPAGYFVAPIPYDVLAKPLAALGADLNGDGRLDLVIPGSESGSVMVLRSGRGFQFDRRDTYRTGARPAAVAAVDLDGDRISDLAVANSEGQSLTVLKGLGNAVFQPHTTTVCGPGPVDVKFDDLNGDGRFDLLVVANRGNELELLLGNGDGRFGTRSGLESATPRGPLVTADLDGDGVPDLISAPVGAGALEVRMGVGPATFAAPRLFGDFVRPVALAVGARVAGERPRLFVADAGANQVVILDAEWAGTAPASTAVLPLGSDGELSALALADLNADGRLDLAVTLADRARVAVCLGTAELTSGFAAPIEVPVGPGASGLAGGDFNHDGAADLVVTARGSSRLRLLSGGVGVPPLTATDYPAGLNLNAPVVDDFNRDGWPDLAAADGDAAELRVWLGDGTGGLAAPRAYSCGAGVTALTLADINGDNRRDLVTANAMAGTVTTWLVVSDGSFKDRADYGVGFPGTTVAAGSLTTPARSDLFVAGGGGSRIARLENGGLLTPVELLEFGAERAGADIVIHWRVGEAGRRHSYRLYRTADGAAEVALADGWLAGAEAYELRDSGVTGGGAVRYRLAELAPDGTRRRLGPVVVPEVGVTPAARLGPPAPNPFRARTALEYAIPAAGAVRLVVYDVGGRVVRTLVARPETAGAHLIEWDGRTDRGAPAGAGLYFVRLDAGGEQRFRKLVRLP